MSRKGRSRLLECYDALGGPDRAALEAFAEFLLARGGTDAAVPEPEAIPRPAEESVVAAMKRLSRSYHMLDKSRILDETSALMAQHVLQGREAGEVIDELEALFERQYRALLEDRR